MKFTKQQLKDLLNNHPNVRWFDEDADKFYFTGAYCLAHGEYERPEYKLTRYKDGYGIKAFYFYHDNTCCPKKDGRIGEGLSGDMLAECEGEDAIKDEEE